MEIIYKIDYPGATKPIRQEVEKSGFPNLDADGQTQYNNTHFSDERAAWDALITKLEAGLSLDTKKVQRQISELEKLKDNLTKTAIMLQEAKEGRNAFMNKRFSS